jgi:hypothetical protein
MSRPRANYSFGGIANCSSAWKRDDDGRGSELLRSHFGPSRHGPCATLSMMTLATTPARPWPRRSPKKISMDMPGPGETRDGVHDIFSTVQGRVIGMMGGGAAEIDPRG